MMTQPETAIIGDDVAAATAEAPEVLEHQEAAAWHDLGDTDQAAPVDVDKAQLGLYLMHGRVTGGLEFERLLELEIMAEYPEVDEAYATPEAFMAEAGADISTGSDTPAARVMAQAIMAVYGQINPTGLPADLDLERLQADYLAAVMGSDPEGQAALEEMQFARMVQDTPPATLEELEAATTQTPRPERVAEPRPDPAPATEAPRLEHVDEQITPEELARLRRNVLATALAGVLAGLAIGAVGYHLWTLYQQRRQAPVQMAEALTPLLSTP